MRRRATGQPKDKIAKDSDRDYFMSAEEAKEYGLIDTVVTPKELATKGNAS